MDPKVVFYQLGTKFVDNEREIPEESEDILYYSLSVGHHTGIIDCFNEKFSCDQEVYEAALGHFPTGSDAHYKLEGIKRRGEIQIDKGHVAVLDNEVKQAIVAAQALDASDEVVRWLENLEIAIEEIKRNPAIYLMGRMV